MIELEKYYRALSQEINPKIMEKEYFMLREEVMTIITSYNENLRNMVAMYPVIATFSWQIDSPYFQFTPILFVILIYFINQSYWKASCKIATYMIVFLKDIDIQWEILHPIFNEHINKIDNQSDCAFWSISPHYYIPLLGSWFLALYKAYVLHSEAEDFYYYIFFECIIAALFLLIFIYGRSKVSGLRSEYIVVWEGIMREIAYKKSNRNNGEVLS